MIKTDLELAELCEDSYGKPPQLSTQVQTGVIVWSYLDTPEEFIVIMRGTMSDVPTDFLEDADGLVPVIDPQMGLLYRGFDNGTTDAWAAIRAQLPDNKPWRGTAHSLGAARLDIISARAQLAGRPPAGVVKFASPRSGGDRLGVVLKSIPGRSYARAGDPIPEVPTEPPYHDPFARIAVGTPVPHTINIFTNHSISRYVADLRLAAVTAGGA